MDYISFTPQTDVHCTAIAMYFDELIIVIIQAKLTAKMAVLLAPTIICDCANVYIIYVKHLILRLTTNKLLLDWSMVIVSCYWFDCFHGVSDPFRFELKFKETTILDASTWT